MNIRFAIALASVLCLPQWAHAEVTISKPWVRATVPGQKVAAAYMEIRSSENATLVGAASPAAKTAEVHEMSMDNGVMKMREIPRLELPAGKTVALKPGGYHVMLTDIVKPLKAGDSVPITLTVETADKRRSTIEIKAEVRDAAKPAGSGMPMNMMH
jgi:periplasmic copper chaperone A